MARYTNVDERVESKSERKVRIFMAIMFFLQTVVTTIPFIQGVVVVDGVERNATMTALNLLIQTGGYSTTAAFPLAVAGGILVVFPMVAFFFCVLDTKSRVKYLVSGLCSVVCAMVIAFGLANLISIGAIITLIINVVTLFMTSQGFQATAMRQRQQKKA